MIITIDGPSGTGKTTIARTVAKKLGITYFDTGAMYRSVAFALLEHGIPLDELERVDLLLKNFTYEIRKEGGHLRYFVNNQDVTKEIRSQRVNEIVSEVSAIPIVRELLWKMQRSYADRQNAVFEGRDMGSTVFPDADVKIYLDASPEVRADRRYKELLSTQPEEAKKWNEKTMKEELLRRDKLDSSRALAPLVCPKDALVIDTSNKTIDEITDIITGYYRKKLKRLSPSWFYSKTMPFFYRFILFVSWCFFRFFYRNQIYGLEHYVKSPAIIAANHLSFLDPPLVASSWPQEIHFLAREGLFRNPVFGGLIRSLNSHPVRGDASDVSVFKTILHLLKEGKQILLFPEGSRSENGDLDTIKQGIGMLLMRSQTLIIPVYIHGTYEIWSRHRKFPKLWGKTACVIGTPISWESFAHLERREAQEAISKHFAASMHALKNWYDAGARGTPP